MDRFWSLRERRGLAVKLIAGIAVLLLMILLLGINSVRTTRGMSQHAAELYRMELLGISHIKEANIDLISADRALRQMVLAPTFVDRDQARAQLDQAMLDLEEEMAAARQSIFRDQERLLLNEFEQEFDYYKRSVNDAVMLVDGSTDYLKKATAYVSGEQFNQVGNSADQLLHRIVSIKEERARETAVAMARHSRDTQWLTLALLLGGLLSGTIVVVSIARSMRQPADRLHAIDNLAKEDAGDTIPTTDGHRNEPGAEDQPLAAKAQQVALVHAEVCEIVENMPEDTREADEQSAIISLEQAAKVGDEARTPERFESPREAPVAPVWHASILFVEDNESNREVTVGLLANAGCKVTIAHSGQEALALLEKSPYDVVLMNMQMMADGINTTEEIRKNPVFDSLSIIAMTPRGVHQDRERCLAAGMNGHIAKPIDPDELFRALMRWVSVDTQHVRIQ